jgi:hypothetical protein
MTEVSGAVTVAETRQSMIRVWMAMSAVWVAFWLLITGLFMMTVEPAYPFNENISSFAAITLTPPLALFVVGAIARLTFTKIEQRKQVRLARR